MGYICHHAIIVTGWSEEAINAAHAEAERIFFSVSDILPGYVNGYHTFLIPPDGSKEGWAESDQGDVRRGEFIGWLNRQRDAEDGSSPLAWAEVQYGDGDGDNRVTRHTDMGREAVEATLGR